MSRPEPLHGTETTTALDRKVAEWIKQSPINDHGEYGVNVDPNTSVKCPCYCMKCMEKTEELFETGPEKLLLPLCGRCRKALIDAMTAENLRMDAEFRKRDRSARRKVVFALFISILLMLVSFSVAFTLFPKNGCASAVAGGLGLISYYILSRRTVEIAPPTDRNEIFMQHTGFSEHTRDSFGRETYVFTNSAFAQAFACVNASSALRREKRPAPALRLRSVKFPVDPLCRFRGLRYTLILLLAAAMAVTETEYPQILTPIAAQISALLPGQQPAPRATARPTPKPSVLPQNDTAPGGWTASGTAGRFVERVPGATSSPYATAAGRYAELSSGSKGNKVSRLQKRLKELGYTIGSADGNYGAKTAKAVAAFNANNRLSGGETATAEMQAVLYSQCPIQADGTAREPKPVDFKNGMIIVEPDYDRVCPLTIQAPGRNCYVFLKYLGPCKSTRERKLLRYAQAPYEDDLAFLVEADKSVDIDVPVGSYKMYVAYGTDFYDRDWLFMEKDTYSKEEDVFDFYVEGTTQHGYTVTLELVVDGNLESVDIPKEQFPR